MRDTYTPVLTPEQIRTAAEENMIPLDDPRIGGFARAIERAAIEAYQRRFERAAIPANSQRWAALDGATAWHLIARHADGWGDVGCMMDEYVAAKVAAATLPDLSTSPVDNQVENRVTDPHQQESEQACGDQIKE